MAEHRYIMEKHLSDHPELEISKKYLIDGKYLMSNCSIHHINFDPKDNRLENLLVCENESKHQTIHSSLLNLVNEL